VIKAWIWPFRAMHKREHALPLVRGSMKLPWAEPVNKFETLAEA